MRRNSLLLEKILRAKSSFLLVVVALSTTSHLLVGETRRAFPEAVTPRAVQQVPSQTDSRVSTKVENSLPPPSVQNSFSTATTTAAGHLAATSSTQAQLQSSHSLYAKKLYELAISQYEKFLVSAPRGGVGRDAALFRLAESYRILGRYDTARNGYTRLIQEFPSGEFTASAAYRLGEIFYSAKNYLGACSHFELAATHAKETGIRLSALFYQARCLELIHYKSKALAIYKELLATAKENPFYYHALIFLAQEDIDAGNRQVGLDKLDEAAQLAPDLATRIEANVRGAQVSLALQQQKAALRRFHNALAIPAVAPEWKAVAWLGLLQLYYQKGEYEKVLAEKEKAAEVSADVRPEGLLLIANSYRQLGKLAEACQIYAQLLQEFPHSVQAKQAHFQRLVALFSLEDPNLLAEIHAYEKQGSLEPLLQAQVSLLKAETLFRKKQFLEAATLFQEIQKSALSDSLKADALYKLGWCYASSQQAKEALLVYSQFIEKYPNSAFLPSILLQRGRVYQQNNAPTEALKDYDAIIAQYPEASREREVALLQRALLLGAKEDLVGMAQTFQQLLSEYPQTAATAQANFWLGWAAYENKEYRNALSYLEKARTLDKANYQERTVPRILLAHYYLKDVEAASREAACIKPENIPPEILRWLGLEFLQLNRLAEAEHYLHLFLNSNPDPAAAATTRLSAAAAEASLSLSNVQLKLKNYPAALATIENYLTTARDPASRGEGLFVKAQILEAEDKVEEALQLFHEVQILQPEGAINAQARLREADLQMRKQDYSQAARAYMAVALLYDDPRFALHALKNAIQAYRQAHQPIEEQKALAQLKKRFPNEVLP